MRIAAKRFRYTLETFEDALGADATGLIDRIKTIQDMAGASHDAGVAARRARTVLGQDGIDRDERDAIERFASAQERCAADVAELARRLASVQGPGFRRTLGRLIVGLLGERSLGIRPAVVREPAAVDEPAQEDEPLDLDDRPAVADRPKPFEPRGQVAGFLRRQSAEAQSSERRPRRHRLRCLANRVAFDRLIGHPSGTSTQC